MVVDEVVLADGGQGVVCRDIAEGVEDTAFTAEEWAAIQAAAPAPNASPLDAVLAAIGRRGKRGVTAPEVAAPDPEAPVEPESAARDWA